MNELLDREETRRWRALCDCASGDLGRPAVTYVQILPEVAYATDSYVLGRLPHTLDVPKAGLLVSAAALKRALSAATYLRLEVVADGLMVHRYDPTRGYARGKRKLGPPAHTARPTLTMTLPAASEMKFPDVAAFIDPAGHAKSWTRTPGPFLLRPALTARIAALAPRAAYDKSAASVWFVGRPAQPLQVFDAGGELLGLVMPVTADTGSAPQSVLDALDWPTAVEAAA